MSDNHSKYRRLPEVHCQRCRCVMVPGYFGNGHALCEPCKRGMPAFVQTESGWEWVPRVSKIEST